MIHLTNLRGEYKHTITQKLWLTCMEINSMIFQTHLFNLIHIHVFPHKSIQRTNTKTWPRWHRGEPSLVQVQDNNTQPTEQTGQPEKTFPVWGVHVWLGVSFLISTTATCYIEPCKGRHVVLHNIQTNIATFTIT